MPLVEIGVAAAVCASSAASALSASALSSAANHLTVWSQSHTGEVAVADLEKARLKAGRDMLYMGWHCRACPSMKFVQVVPQMEGSLMEILNNPVFQNSSSLKKWMEHQLRQALKLKVGSEDFKNETVDSQKSDKGNFSAMMAVFFARAIPCEDITISAFAKDTAEEVHHRVKELGSRYHSVAELLWSDGIDGRFLAQNDISREDLAGEYDVRRKIQQDVLLNLFGEYKPRVVPSIAIGVVACSAEFDHKHTSVWSFSPDDSSHETLKVSAQKVMAYHSASKVFDMNMMEPHLAQERPQPSTPSGSGFEFVVPGQHASQGDADRTAA